MPKPTLYNHADRLATTRVIAPTSQRASAPSVATSHVHVAAPAPSTSHLPHAHDYPNDEPMDIDEDFPLHEPEDIVEPVNDIDDEVPVLTERLGQGLNLQQAPKAKQYENSVRFYSSRGEIL